MVVDRSVRSDDHRQIPLRARLMTVNVAHPRSMPSPGRPRSRSGTVGCVPRRCPLGSTGDIGLVVTENVQLIGLPGTRLSAPGEVTMASGVEISYVPSESGSGRPNTATAVAVWTPRARRAPRSILAQRGQPASGEMLAIADPAWTSSRRKPATSRRLIRKIAGDHQIRLCPSSRSGPRGARCNARRGASLTWMSTITGADTAKPSSPRARCRAPK